MEVRQKLIASVAGLCFALAAQATPSKVLQENGLNNLRDMSYKEVTKHQQYIDKLFRDKHAQAQNKNVKKADGAILFISFSMPNDLIIELASQAKKYHIPVVVRGLVQNDFKKTLAKIYQVKTKSKQRGSEITGVSIDPVWFEQFNIKKVPALVVTRRNPECQLQKICSNQSYDVVYGNAPIKNSLQLIADSSSNLSGVAKRYLEGAYNA